MTRHQTSPCTVLRRASGFAAVLFMADSAAARADVTVTAAGSGYDIEVSGQATSADVIAAIAAATRATASGTPDTTPVLPNHLAGASLVRALRVLLPHAPFVIRYRKDGTPEAIILLTPVKSAGAAAITRITPSLTASPAGNPVPASGRDAFVKSLPMIRTK